MEDVDNALSARRSRFISDVNAQKAKEKYGKEMEE